MAVPSIETYSERVFIGPEPGLDDLWNKKREVLALHFVKEVGSGVERLIAKEVNHCSVRA